MNGGRYTLSKLLPLTMIGILPGPAQAWTRLGHQTIANIAELDLRANAPQAWSEIQDLLSTDSNAQIASGKIYLANVASWADDIRHAEVEGVKQTVEDPNVDHTARIPYTGVIPSHPCTGEEPKRCADEAVTYYGTVLGDRTHYTTAQRQEALRYIVHLVGDLHQPLHGSEPIGYNVVDMPGRHLMLDKDTPYNIHAIWDFLITDDHRTPGSTTSPTAGRLASELMNNGQSFSYAGGPRDWARESTVIAHNMIFNDPGLPACGGLTGVTCPGSYMLSSTYTIDKYPIVAQRLKQAGYRLSCFVEKSLNPAATVSRCG